MADVIRATTDALAPNGLAHIERPDVDLRATRAGMPARVDAFRARLAAVRQAH